MERAHYQQNEGPTLSQKRLLQESLRLFQELGDKPGVASALDALGDVAVDEGDYATARSLLEQSMGIRLEVGHKLGIALTLGNLARLSMLEGDYTNPHFLREENVAIIQEIGDKVLLASALSLAGGLARRQGDYAAAYSFFEEGLALSHEIRDKKTTIWCVEGIANVGSARGKVEEAVRLWGAVEAMREAIEMPMGPSWQLTRDQDVAASRARLGAATWQVAWEEGRAMNMEQAVAYALERLKP